MLKEFITCRFCKEVHKRDYYPSSGSLFVNGVDVKARKNVCKSCMKEYKHKKYKKAGKVKCSCD